jgi:hypothetical protein
MCSTNLSLRRFSWISHPHESFTDIMLLNHTWLHTHLITTHLIWSECSLDIFFIWKHGFGWSGFGLHLGAVLVNLSCKNNHLTIMFALTVHNTFAVQFWSTQHLELVLILCVWCASFAQHITTPTNNSITQSQWTVDGLSSPSPIGKK